MSNDGRIHVSDGVGYYCIDLFLFLFQIIIVTWFLVTPYKQQFIMGPEFVDFEDVLRDLMLSDNRSGHGCLIYVRDVFACYSFLTCGSVLSFSEQF